MCGGNTSTGDITTCPYISKLLPVERIPTFLGGKCNCKGGCCVGGLPNTQTTPADVVGSDGFTDITISARYTQTVQLSLVKDSQVKFFFNIEYKSLGIQAVVVPLKAGDEECVLMEKQIVEDNQCPLMGTWTAPIGGTLIITFDNSHSLLRSKKLRYKIDVMLGSDSLLDSPSA